MKYKIAGTLQVAPRLLNEVEEWASMVYCSEVSKKLSDIIELYEIKGVDEERIKKIEDVKAECQKISKNNKFGKSEMFYIQPSDLGYQLKELEDFVSKAGGDYQPRLAFRVSLLTTAFEYKAKTKMHNISSEWKGVWLANKTPAQSYSSFNLGQIFLYMNVDKEYPTSLNMLHNNLNTLKSLVGHELRHFYQSVIKYITKSYIAGLPGTKHRTKDYTPTGHLKGKQHSLPVNEKGKLIHPLRDIEFYPKLNDAIVKFNYYVNEFLNKYKIQSSSLKKIIALITSMRENKEDAQETQLFQGAYKIIKEELSKRISDIDELDEIVSDAKLDFDILIEELSSRSFFLDLKKHLPEKWKKAVKEFLKAVLTD